MTERYEFKKVSSSWKEETAERRRGILVSARRAGVMLGLDCAIVRITWWHVSPLVMLRSFVAASNRALFASIARTTSRSSAGGFQEPGNGTLGNQCETLPRSTLSSTLEDEDDEDERVEEEEEEEERSERFKAEVYTCDHVMSARIDDACAT